MISVIVPCYNAREWIADTLRSAQYASSIPIEVIVVDDGSTDGSGDIVDNEFPGVRLVRTENRGVSHARNLGIDMARGECLVFLDADDKIVPGKYERQLNLLVEAKADIVYSPWQKLVKNAKGDFELGDAINCELGTDPELDFMAGFWCPTGAYLFTRAAVERTGRFDNNYPVIQDAVFAATCALNGSKFVFDRDISCLYRVHDRGSISTTSRAAFLADCIRHQTATYHVWEQSNRLTQGRRTTLLHGLDGLVANIAKEFPEKLADAAREYLALSQGRPPPSFGIAKSLAVRLLGYKRFHRIWANLRQLSGRANQNQRRPGTYR